MLHYTSPDAISPSVTYFLHEKGIMGPLACFFSAEYFVAQMPQKESESMGRLDLTWTYLRFTTRCYASPNKDTWILQGWVRMEEPYRRTVLKTARPKVMKLTKLIRVLLTLLSVDHWRPVGNVSWCELSLSWHPHCPMHSSLVASSWAACSTPNSTRLSAVRWV